MTVTLATVVAATGLFAWGAVVAALFLWWVERSAAAVSGAGSVPRTLLTALALAAPAIVTAKAAVATLFGFIVGRSAWLVWREVGRADH